MKTVYLKRCCHGELQTLGHLIDAESGEEIAVTLELPDRENYSNISRIPAGIYIVLPRLSQKYKRHFIIKNVPGRSYILFHSGNYNTDTRGCVLVGESFKDINGDGTTDIRYSTRAMKKLLALYPDGFKLKIQNKI